MTTPHATLASILQYHRQRAEHDDRQLTKLIRQAQRVVDPPSLLDGLVRPPGEPLRVIAEVKRRSPSAGDLATKLDVASLVLAYQDGGAAAISVLTDTPHFGGDPRDVATVRGVCDLPVLRKDFTVCPADVADARLMGADAVLLIVAALGVAELRAFMDLAGRLGIDALVEVHDEAELAVALDLGAQLVGVNQRDLTTFTVDQDRAARVAAAIPPGVLAVAESGIGGPDDAAAVAAAGYDAVLVGESLVRAGDRTAATAALAALERGDRPGGRAARAATVP